MKRRMVLHDAAHGLVAMMSFLVCSHVWRGMSGMGIARVRARDPWWERLAWLTVVVNRTVVCAQARLSMYSPAHPPRHAAPRPHHRHG